MNLMAKRTRQSCMNRLPCSSSKNSSTHHRFVKQRQHHMIAQNFVLVWLDENIIEFEEIFHNSITQLHTTVNSLEIFTDVNKCAMFLTEIQDQKLLLIVSNSLGPNFVPLIHDNPHLDSVYVFSVNNATCTQWTTNWYKIRGVFTELNVICDLLKKDIKRCDHNLEPMSIVPFIDSSTEKFQNIDESFIYTQVLKEVLLNIDYDESARDELTEFCSELYKDNPDELSIINEFHTNYEKHSPIWWYTRECFTYRMLNRALRTPDIDIVIKMGFFMRDLHQQIQELHSKLAIQNSFFVYRGQGMFDGDFEKLQNSKNGLLSFNNFLSTSLDKAISLRFARDARDKFSMIGIFFQMKIHPTVTNTPFAPVDDVGYYKNSEKEILFSMHTIFRICELKKIDDRLWEVELEMIPDDDQQLQALIALVRYEIRGTTERYRLGNLMIHLKQFNQAEKFYQMLLDSTSEHNQTEIAHLNSQMACIMEEKGDYKKACQYYQKTLAIQEKYFPSTHPSLADIYHNLAIVNTKLENYRAALNFFRHAVKIGVYNSFPENDSRFKFWKDSINDIQTKI